MSGTTSFGSGIPRGGHARFLKRSRKYDPTIMAKSVASEAISVPMPHHAAGLPKRGGSIVSASVECQASSTSPSTIAIIAATSYFSTTSTLKNADRTNANVIGHGDECGMRTTSAGRASTNDVCICSCPASSSSPRYDTPSQFGYALVTVGMTAKLYSGGGEGIVHSSVGPCQGS